MHGCVAGFALEELRWDCHSQLALFCVVFVALLSLHYSEKIVLLYKYLHRESFNNSICFVLFGVRCTSFLPLFGEIVLLYLHRESFNNSMSFLLGILSGILFSLYFCIVNHYLFNNSVLVQLGILSGILISLDSPNTFSKPNDPILR